MTYAALKHIAKAVVPKTLLDWISTVRRYESASYNYDGLLSIHNCDFISDPRFARAYNVGKATGSWGNATIYWRAYVCCWAADIGSRLEGDFVECGVNRGGLAGTVMEFTNFQTLDKKFYLLDTYEGLVERHITQEEKNLGRLPGGYEPCYEEVKRTFAHFDNAVIVRGAVPETLHRADAQKVAYLSIDMNCAEPEIAAAEFYWPRMSSGAVMVLDDYGWQGHIHQKRAFDEFASRHRVLVLPLPTGQGLIIKP